MPSYGSLWPGAASEIVTPVATPATVIQRHSGALRSMTV